MGIGNNRQLSFASSDVAEVFDAVPEAPREKLLQLRQLIFETAEKTRGVGDVVETLKWGEPSYLSSNKSGTTLRIHWKERSPELCALYVPCQTDLLEQFRSLDVAGIAFEGKRAVLFPVKGRLPKSALRECIRLALTYQLTKK